MIKYNLITKETFKYIWWGGEFGQIVMWLKKFNSLFLLLYLRYMWGEGIGSKSHIEEGLAENVRIPSYGVKGLKLLKKRPMIFERSLTILLGNWPWP